MKDEEDKTKGCCSLDIRRVHLHKRIVRLEHLSHVPRDLSTQLALLVVSLHDQPLSGRLERREERALVETEESFEPAKDHLALGEGDDGFFSADGGFGGFDVELDDVSETSAVGLFGSGRRQRGKGGSDQLFDGPGRGW
jgi:hypothetical protein